MSKLATKLVCVQHSVCYTIAFVCCKMAVASRSVAHETELGMRIQIERATFFHRLYQQLYIDAIP